MYSLLTHLCRYKCSKLHFFPPKIPSKDSFNKTPNVLTYSSGFLKGKRWPSQLNCLTCVLTSGCVWLVKMVPACISSPARKWVSALSTQFLTLVGRDTTFFSLYLLKEEGKENALKTWGKSFRNGYLIRSLLLDVLPSPCNENVLTNPCPRWVFRLGSSSSAGVVLLCDLGQVS